MRLVVNALFRIRVYHAGVRKEEDEQKGDEKQYKA
jgi:hypothetical protein